MQPSVAALPLAGRINSPPAEEPRGAAARGVGRPPASGRLRNAGLRWQPLKASSPLSQRPHGAPARTDAALWPLLQSARALLRAAGCTAASRGGGRVSLCPGGR